MIMLFVLNFHVQLSLSVSWYRHLAKKKKSWMLKIIKINRFKCMFNNSNNNKRWKFFERFNSLFFYLNSQYEKGKNFSLYNSICASILFGYKIDLRTFFSYDRLILCILCYYYLDRIFFFVLTLSIWSGGMECRFFLLLQSFSKFIYRPLSESRIHSFIWKYHNEEDVWMNDK